MHAFDAYSPSKYPCHQIESAQNPAREVAEDASSVRNLGIEIGAAVRYAHSSWEVADLKDIEQLGRLVAGMALEIDEQFKQAWF